MGSARFSPVAIVGRSCLLPGALDPGELWQAVRDGRDLLCSTPEGRWGIDPRHVLCSPDAVNGDRSWTDRGGYVQDFEERWDAEGFAIPAGELDGLDPLFHWVLHCAREALRDAGCPEDRQGRRVGAVLGNLSFPSTGMARFAEATWINGLPGYGPPALQAAGLAAGDARNRFMSSLPALLLQRALRLDAGAFALDAACASSLYAIKLACDALQDGRADLMLAGAVNRADDLFIHIGFCALNAMSRSGRSRPFHRHADGLVPAEGAGIVVLKRLADAEQDGDTVHGVIRGIALCNDGSSKGLLAPSEQGQVRAMRDAYTLAGIDPREVSLLECHATGTPVGDATEVRSMAQVFAEHAGGLPIGSLKSNLGHLITVAGVAGVIKVLEAMRAGERPPTLHAEEPLAEITGSSLRLLHQLEPWPDDEPRCAGVSAFGFGGNNAHLIVEQHRPDSPITVAVPELQSRAVEIAVVGIGACVADCSSHVDFAEALLAGESRLQQRSDGSLAGVAADIELAMAGLRIPPADLEQTLAQQLLLLRAAREAVAGIALPSERSSCIVGMEADAEIARYGTRWRLGEWAQHWGADADWLAEARDGVVNELQAAGVVGTMPNIPANRLNALLDLRGPSFTVSAAEASGLAAFAQAVRGLQAGEIDAALVGASDLSCEPVHEAAARQVLPADTPPGDAAVVLVLKRLGDAVRDGDRVYAVIEPGVGEDGGEVLRLGNTEGATNLAERFGHAHAAAGLVHLAGAALALQAGMWPGGLQPQLAVVEMSDMAGLTHRVALRRGPDGSAQARGEQASTAAPEGTCLRFPAHPAAVSLPPLPMPTRQAGRTLASEPRSGRLLHNAPAHPQHLDHDVTMVEAEPVVKPVPDSSIFQIMVPAPWLPPVGEELSDDEGSEPAVAEPESTAPGPAATVPVELSGVLAQAQQFQEQVASLHREFMTRQTEMHQRYLRLQATAIQHLVRARGGQPVPELQLPASPLEIDTPARPRPVMVQPTVTPAIVTQDVEPPPPEAPAVVLDRSQLEVHASGRISELFGSLFADQDGYPRQVRMPEPPLLLADRVTRLDAEAGSMGTGIICTETDVQGDAWYLHHGRMPAGIMIESGQADLLLISYLGIDLLNRGERVYRLLGCQLTYHGELPAPGETLRYEIEVDGHAKQGDVRLFFFHYNCTVNGSLRLAVREGQAGFFSDRELADSAGVLWSPEDAEITATPRLEPPPVACRQRSFTAEQVRAFAEGRPWQCFGDDLAYARTHNRTPAIQGDRKLFLERVTSLEPEGGPWRRGYLRAETDIRPDDWYFDGHFKGDPCMPGTLMFEACLQTMAFYLAALGFTVERDGWRFQPVIGEPYDLRCRGQVIPGSQQIVYEVFVEELFVDAGRPTLYADLLCTVDGLKAFHARRVGLQLVPDWPLTSHPELLAGEEPDRQLASIGGLRLDRAALLATAWGQPSRAFGPMYERFDGPRRVPRLPGPPYHFMSRIARIDGEPGVLEPGASIELEYDVPRDAWFFEENGSRTMPYCCLLEAALQPCGWLGSFAGSTLVVDDELYFRNLDGTGTQFGEVGPGPGILRTKVTLTDISRSGSMLIESFTVSSFLEDQPVYELQTVFGFFPKAALANQAGLPTSDEQRALLEAPSDNGFSEIDLRELPERYWGRALTPARPRLLMLDRIDGLWLTGDGHDRIRARKEIDPGEWFFKAHFFQDPVQPGSLGLEAMLQLLQLFMLETGMAEGIDQPRFEPVALGVPLTWKYRGQVLPRNRLVTVTLEVVERGNDERGPYALASASLWVDGLRIYEATNLGMRIVSGRQVSG